MPSGITSPLYDLSTKATESSFDEAYQEFLVRGAQSFGFGAFGFSVDVSDFYIKNYIEASASREAWLSMDARQRRAEYDRWVAETEEYNAERRKRARSIENTYLAARARVEQLQVDPRLANYKQSMLDQLDESTKWDASPYTVDIPEFDEWESERTESLERSVARAEDQVQKEIDRQAERAAYIELFMQATGIDREYLKQFGSVR